MDSRQRRPTSETTLRARLGFVAASLFLKLALDAAYVGYLQVAFADHFLTPFVVNLSLIRYLESNLWIAAVALLVPFDSRNLSGVFFASALLFLFIPLATMFGMDYERTRLTLALTALAIVVSYIVSSMPLGNFKIYVPKNGEIISIIICLIGIVYFLYLSYYTDLLFKMNFNLDIIYDLRDSYVEILDIGILTYFNIWTQKICLPFILAIGLNRRSWWMIGLAIIMHFITFGLTQHRAYLFAPLLVILSWYLYSKKFTFITGFFIAGIFIFIILLVVVNYGLDDTGALLLRRAFFVAASVTDSWVIFFMDQDKVYFSDKLLSWIVVNQYNKINLPIFLGDVFRFGLEIAFNGGLVATGYAQMGVVGVIFYAILFGFFLRAVNVLINAGVPAFIPAAILFVPLRTAWADSDLFTALLSHGLIVGLLLTWLYGGSGQSRQDIRTEKPNIIGRAQAA